MILYLKQLATSPPFKISQTPSSLPCPNLNPLTSSKQPTPPRTLLVRHRPRINPLLPVLSPGRDALELEVEDLLVLDEALAGDEGGFGVGVGED